jgi:hypothetical protein
MFHKNLVVYNSEFVPYVPLMLQCPSTSSSVFTLKEEGKKKRVKTEENGGGQCEFI